MVKNVAIGLSHSVERSGQELQVMEVILCVSLPYLREEMQFLIVQYAVILMH